MAAHASAFAQRAVFAEGGVKRPRVVHADNGSAEKDSTLLATLQALGIAPPNSHPW